MRKGKSKSEKCLAIKREADRKKKIREKQKHPSYAGENGSQYGTFWITDGTTNKKWKDDLGKLPRSFHRGRTT